MAHPSGSEESAVRKPNMREAILCAAEELFSTNGFNAVSVRDIAQAAGANPGSVTYHFKTKDGLLLEIYRRHCGPMNRRRSELLAAARRVRDLQDRLEAIVRAYVLPAFSSGSDLAGGGARFTRLRAVMSAEGNEVAGRIIAQTFDDTSHAFIDAIHDSLPICGTSTRLPKSSGAAIFFWARCITRWSSLNACRGCRAETLMVRMRPVPSSSWCGPPSRRFRLPDLIGLRRCADEWRHQPSLREDRPRERSSQRAGCNRVWRCGKPGSIV